MAGLGTAPAIILGVGVGEAAAAAIEPLVEPAKQKAWRDHKNRILDPGTLARLAAQGGITLDAAKVTGESHGLTDDKMQALYYLAQTVPGVSEALTLYRRQAMANADYSTEFNHALVKAGLDPRYVDAITGLIQNILSPETVANAVQQGHMANEAGPGGATILPALDTTVAAFPRNADFAPPDGAGAMAVPLTTIGLPPIAEATGSGIEFDRLQIMANLAGLPPGQHELLEMWNRGLIDEASVDAGIREGHTKTKWIGPFKRLRWSVMSHLQYVEARVRGWITNEQMYAGGALTGYTPAQLDLLHSTHGRPISARAVARGLARGGKRLDPVADFTGANPIAVDGSNVPAIPDTLFKAMQQSNVQQQWYDLERHDIVNYPSLFMLNRLAIADPAYIPRAVTILGYLIYDPVDIAAIEAYWNKQTGAAVGVKKETLSQLTQEFLAGVLSQAAFTTALGGLGYTAQQAADLIVTTEFKAASAERNRATRSLEKRYVAAQISDTTAQTQLALLGWPQGVIDAKLAAWLGERDEQLTSLTVAQIEKALKAGALTAAQASPLLADLGEDAAAIAAILASNPLPVPPPAPTA